MEPNAINTYDALVAPGTGADVKSVGANDADTAIAVDTERGSQQPIAFGAPVFYGALSIAVVVGCYWFGGAAFRAGLEDQIKFLADNTQLKGRIVLDQVIARDLV